MIGFLDGRWDVAVFVDNVTDERALLALDQERGTRARVGYLTNPPRSVGVSTRIDSHRGRFLIVLPHLDTPPARTLSQSSVQENPGALDFRHQLLLPRPYLVLTKPLRLDIQCQRAASVKIGWKYLDD